MTEPSSAPRPSHDLLMRVTETLTEATEVERTAGNQGVAMVLNDLVISMFKLALDTEIDELANQAYAARYPEQPGAAS